MGFYIFLASVASSCRKPRSSGEYESFLNHKIQSFVVHGFRVSGVFPHVRCT